MPFSVKKRAWAFVSQHAAQTSLLDFCDKSWQIFCNLPRHHGLYLYIYIHTYIYICVCVCARKKKVKQQMKLNVKEQKGLTCHATSLMKP